MRSGGRPACAGRLPQWVEVADRRERVRRSRATWSDCARAGLSDGSSARGRLLRFRS